MVWSAVALIAGLVAQQTSADAEIAHLVALAVGYAAVAVIVVPEFSTLVGKRRRLRRARNAAQSASWRRPQ